MDEKIRAAVRAYLDARIETEDPQIALRLADALADAVVTGEGCT